MSKTKLTEFEMRKRFYALMLKWAEYKRKGSEPHPADYLRDAKERTALAKELDLLIHGQAHCPCEGGTKCLKNIEKE